MTGARASRCRSGTEWAAVRTNKGVQVRQGMQVVTGLLIGAMLFGAGVWLGQRNASPAHAAAPTARVAAVAPARASASARSAMADVSAARPAHPFPQVPRTREGLTGEVEVFGGDSEEEARWLDRHGFPNAVQWRQYPAASDALLEQAAAAGDGVARTLLDERRLRTDPDAQTRLLLAGAEGNLYALQVLSAYKARPKGEVGEAYAISRVAEMRGDVMLSLSRPVVFAGRLSQVDQMTAEAEALVLNHHLNQIYRQKYGVDPPAIEPRPYQVDDF